MNPNPTATETATEQSPTARAIEMLRVAASYIELHCPDGTIWYDEAWCDGACVADDCRNAVVELGAMNKEAENA